MGKKQAAGSGQPPAKRLPRCRELPAESTLEKNADAALSGNSHSKRNRGRGQAATVSFEPRPANLPADPAPPAYRSSDETLSRLQTLRATGKHQLDWPAVGQALGMAPRTLYRWRLLLAAELRAEGWGWVEIAGHPAVDLNADYLRKEAGPRKLPSGLSFAEHCEALATARAARSRELQEARGAAAAERIYAMSNQLLDSLEQLVPMLDDFIKHPPEVFNPNGAELLACETVKQLLIPYPGEIVNNDKPRKRITAPFARYLAAMARDLTASIGAAESVMVSHQPPEAQPTDEHDDSLPVTAAELAARKERAARLLTELQSYEGAA